MPIGLRSHFPDKNGNIIIKENKICHLIPRSSQVRPIYQEAFMVTSWHLGNYIWAFSEDPFPSLSPSSSAAVSNRTYSANSLRAPRRKRRRRSSNCPNLPGKLTKLVKTKIAAPSFVHRFPEEISFFEKKRKAFWTMIIAEFSSGIERNSKLREGENGEGKKSVL